MKKSRFIIITYVWLSIKFSSIVVPSLVKVLNWNSFRANQIYSDSFRNLFPIRKKLSISFDVIRLKINSSQSESIPDF